MLMSGAVFERTSRGGCRMANSIGIRPQARLDVVELATYIGQDSEPAANRFLDACEATFEFLAISPQIGAIYPTKNPIGSADFECSA